jgi:hypothetical protein
MKIKILLTLWGLLPLLGGCTAEQVADFKAGFNRGYERGQELRNEILSGAANGLGAYARGYSETYQSLQTQDAFAPKPVEQGAFSPGVHTYFPRVGEGLPVIYSVDGLGDIHEY